MKKLISYVFPVYNEEENIDKLYEIITSLLINNNKYEFELVFVNDGSKDNSLLKLYELLDKDNRVVVVNLSRNYGHQLAVTAGIDTARGEAIIIMDSDLQDPPEVSFELINKWEEGYQVVYAQRTSREDTWFKKITADIYYRILKNLADIDIPRNTGDFRLIDRKVADELKKFKEHNRYLRGLFSYIGFKQTAVQFNRNARYAGSTNYTMKKMLKLAGDGILSFSSTPLKVISRFGYIIALLSFFGMAYVLAIRIFTPQNSVAGWAFITLSIFFIGGVQLIMLGLLGSYIGRIYIEVLGRPLYGVESVKKGKK